MKKNLQRTIIALALLLATAFSIPVQAQTFQKAYDLGTDDYLNMSVIDTAGNIVSSGSSNYAGAGQYDAVLAKFDTSGTLLWQKQYGGAGTEFGTSMAASTSGSGYVIAGRSNSFTGSSNLDITLIKTDNNGDLQWAKTYGTDSTEHALFVSATYDDGYIITGQTRSVGNGGLDLFLLKTDSTGTVEWFKTFGSAGNEAGFHVVQDMSDSGYVAVGYSGFGGSGLNDAYLVKTDKDGNLQGQLLIGGTGDDAGRRLLFTPTGMGILTGVTRHQIANSQDDIFVVAIDFPNNLAVKWSKTFGSPDGNDSPTNIVPFPDGSGYAFSANSSSFGAPTGLLFLVDTAGVFRGGLNYQGPGNVFFQDLQFTSDMKAALTGFGTGFGGTDNDFYVIAFPGDPQNTCTRQDIFFPGNNFSATVLGPVINTHTATTISTPEMTVTFTQSSATATEYDVCGNLPLTAYAGTDKTICSGSGSVELGGSPAAEGGSGPYTYLWTPSTGLDDSTSQSPNASPSATTTYTLTVTDSLGATAVDDVTVTISSGPNAAINPPGPNICGGQNVTLTASGGVSYVWNTGDMTAAIVKNPSMDTTTYSVTVTDASGCTASTSQTVIMHPRPNNVTITPNNPSICPGDNVTLTATSTENYTTFVWTPSTGLSDDSIAAPIASPTTTTTYTVTPKNAHCTGNTVDVTVTVTSTPVVTVTPSAPTICDTASTGVTLVASGATTYTWSPAAGLSNTTIPNPVATPTATTTYTVTGSSSCGTSAPVTVVVTVDICIGIRDLPQTFSSVFPNPASDKVNLTFDARTVSDGVLSVIAVDGRVVSESNIMINHGVNTFTLDVTALPTGLHFVRITTAEITAVAKVMIE